MKSSLPPSFSLFLNYNPFHNIIHYYVDLSTFLVTIHGTHPDSPRVWWALNRRKRVTSLYALEIQYGGLPERDRFVEQCFKEVQEKKKTICGERLGFKDLFVPVRSKKRILGYVQAGAFADKEITPEWLAKCWEQLSGREASPDLPEFREFTRALLEIPVLEGKLFPAFQEALELFAQLLSGSGEEESIGQRLQQLQVQVFSKLLPNSYWLDWALGRPTSDSVPPWDRRMEKWGWTKDEIGLTRIPTTVLTVIPRHGDFQKMDWISESVRINRFQRRSFHFAHTLPETVGGKMEDYGAAFVISADPKLPRLAQRQHIEGIARKIEEFAAKELGGPVLVGIGQTVAPGEPLNPSYRQAVLALHLWKGSGKNIVVFDGDKKSVASGGFADLRSILDDLNKAFETASFSDLEILKERFLKQAIQLSFQTPYEIRWHFRYALDRLAETVSKRVDLGKKESRLLRGSVAEMLDKAVTFQETVQAYQEALSKLEKEIERPYLAQKDKSIGMARDYLDRDYKKRIRINQLAKMAGMSVSTFSRRFKKLTGLGLETYLQQRRLDEAKRLLKATRLPIFRITRDCGFKSVSYFIHLFRKNTGLTPEKYRQRP